MIELFYPYVPEEAKLEVLETLGTRWIGQGPKCARFEEAFQDKFNTTYSISMNSGSAALETAYELADIQSGDEVITTPLTCTATNIPLLRMGAKIVWADIDPHTLCIDRKDILAKITTKTKAIVNVHLGGIDNNIGSFSINGRDIPVISDACQALGVFSGDYVANSFQAIKHITTGDGGMLTVNNESDAKEAKLKRWFGIDREKKLINNWQAYTKRQMTFDIDMLGYKRQMTDIAAGMGLAGLKHYDSIIDHREGLFELYKRLLPKEVKLIDGKHNTYWLCTVLVDNRDDFAKMLFENEVDTNMVQIRNDAYTIFGGKADLPIMDAIEDQYISLPLNMNTTEDDVRYICGLIRGGW